jgi:hypothetical protein
MDCFQFCYNFAFKFNLRRHITVKPDSATVFLGQAAITGQVTARYTYGEDLTGTFTLSVWQRSGDGRNLHSVHFSAQRKRFLLDRGCMQGLFRGCLWGTRGW